MSSLFGKSIQKTVKSKTVYKTGAELGKFAEKNHNQFINAQELYTNKFIEVTYSKMSKEYTCYLSSEEQLEKFKLDKKKKYIKHEYVDETVYEVNVREAIDKQFSLVQLGVNILSMSKKIMNEVMCLAHDLGIRIYYQDTDSMHIELDGVNPNTGLSEKDYNLNH